MFSVIDYGIFTSMIVISCVIGIYFGCTKKNQSKTEYLLGGSKMKVIPVAMSSIASYISGFVLLAVPTEVYLYGANVLFFCVSLIIIGFLTVFFYLPVIMKLKVPSSFEYLNLRFNKKVRTLAFFLYTFQMLIYHPVVLYLPAIVFSLVTGVDTYLASAFICITCTFYTTIGGFKAVIWTDVVQLLAIVVSVLIVFFLGVHSVGGFGLVWSKAIKGHRLDFDFSFDPTARDGVWSIIASGTVILLNILCFNPSSVQKYLSTSNLINAQRVVVITCLGVMGIYIFIVFTGLILYATYESCDPFTSGKIAKHDQILIKFFLDIGGSTSGLTGIFVAGIFGAALSTLSTAFNTLAATLYGDFILPYMPKDFSPNTERRILQLIVLVYGLVCTCLTFLIKYLGNVFHFVNSGTGCLSGVLVGLYSLGMLFPMANSKGAIWGTIVGFTISVWISFGHQWYTFKGAFNSFIKSLPVGDCNFYFNSTSFEFDTNVNKPFILYRLSNWYHSLISVTLVILVGLVVSYVTKRKEEVPDPDLLSPFIHFVLEKIGKKRQIKTELGLNELDAAET